MKKILPLFLLVLGLLAPLQAQTSSSPTFDPATGGPAPGNMPRMPMAFSHKPNPTPPPAELAAPIDKFFKSLKGGDYAASYEGFLSGTRLGQQKEKMSFFISKTQEAFGIYGALNDYEIYDNYTIGSNVIVLTYLSRHPVQPLRWRFIYYRPEKTWGLVNMAFDDVLLDLLD